MGGGVLVVVVTSVVVAVVLVPPPPPPLLVSLLLLLVPLPDDDDDDDDTPFCGRDDEDINLFKYSPAVSLFFGSRCSICRQAARILELSIRFSFCGRDECLATFPPD